MDGLHLSMCMSMVNSLACSTPSVNIAAHNANGGDFHDLDNFEIGYETHTKRGLSHINKIVVIKWNDDGRWPMDRKHDDDYTSGANYKTIHGLKMNDSLTS